MSLVLLKDGNSSKQYVQVEIFYTDLFDSDTLITTVTLKPASIPALGYNIYQNFVSSGALDVCLQMV